MTIDLRALQCSGAIACHAAQDWQSSFLASHWDRPLRVPGVLGRDLDFLGESGLFRLGVVLASASKFRAGHDYHCFIRNRDRSLGSVLICDSGGFDLIGMTKLPPPAWFEANWRAQELFADIALTPDAPTQAASKGRNKDLRTYAECLRWTRRWLTEYAKRRERRGQGPVILNVLQGRTEEEWEHWLAMAVSFQGALGGGWAFAGALRARWGFVLSRILHMMEKKLLDGVPWIHFLGLGSVSTAVILTAIRDGLRTALSNPRLEISFDDAQSAIAHSQGFAVPVLPQIGPYHAVVSAMDLPDDPTLIGCGLPFSPANGPLVYRGMTLGHICHRQPDPSAKRPTTWDHQSQVLLAHHVTYVRAHALGQAAVASLYPPQCAAQQLPYKLIELRHVIFDVLIKQNYGLLAKWRAALDRPGAGGT